MKTDSAVLLIAWRRPHTLRQVIDSMRPVAPARLFVACDGPNPARPGEVEKVSATRAVIENEIDWPCNIERLYADTNQGCRLGVSRAISWFFEQVEEGIILEDDCVPHPDFFPYCTELLERYRHDTRVWSICGSNFQFGRRRGDASYYFTIHGDSWGWATWRTAWAHYGEAEEKWLDFKQSNRMRDVFPISLERDYWKEVFDRLFSEDLPDTWDYQWWLCCWMNNGLHACPNTNLITNSGYGSDATHTIKASELSRIPLEPLGELTHPSFVLPDREADSYTFYRRRLGVLYLLKKRFGLAHIIFLIRRTARLLRMTQPDKTAESSRTRL